MAASLASATSSRVDSASKHIVPCKVNTDFLTSMMHMNKNDASRELQQNKMKYCMHKDDVVIGLGRPTYGTSINMCTKKAYPSVITTVAGSDVNWRRWMAMVNFMVEDENDTVDLKEHFESIVNDSASFPAETRDELVKFKPVAKRLVQDIKNMLDFHFVGISLGLAYAHSHSGDTVGSVMVGGLKTVLNGAFPVHTNDLLMFYFDEEIPLFLEDGDRAQRNLQRHDGKVQVTTNILKFLNGSGTTIEVAEPTKYVLTSNSKRRMMYHDQQQGTYARTPEHGASTGKTCVAKIKPYITSKHSEFFPCDRRRVFGRAISNAQPYEMVDIVLSRQSI